MLTHLYNVHGSWLQFEEGRKAKSTFKCSIFFLLLIFINLIWLRHSHGHGQQTTMPTKQQHHFNVSLKAFKMKPFRNETKLEQARTNGNDDENDDNNINTSNISNKKMAFTRNGFIAYSFGFCANFPGYTVRVVIEKKSLSRECLLFGVTSNKKIAQRNCKINVSVKHFQELFVACGNGLLRTCCNPSELANNYDFEL